MLGYKNKPYVWGDAENYPQKGLLEYNWREQKTDDLIFMRGHPVPEQDYNLIFRCDLDEERFQKYDILPNLSVAPIVNQRTSILLSSICPTDFQVFPVTIINGPKTTSYENHDYSLINFTRQIDSVDREHSYLDVRQNKKTIRNIRRLVFKPGCMGDFHLAREMYFHPLGLVSPTIVKAFKKEKIKGARFLTDLESYNESFPEEYLASAFSQKPESAKRYFISQLNDKERYAFFKTRIPKIPREILESLINMTLSRSSFHKEQCEEIREIMKRENQCLTEIEKEKL